MIHSRDILNSLPLLAAVLGRHYGVEVRIGGDEAKTNGHVILIPALPRDCEAELLGYARGYIDHEAAHIRHSDFEALKRANLDAVTFTITNAIEDWRVEERQAELFPGCRQHFDWLTRKLCLEGGREETEKAGTIPAFSMLEYVILVTSAWAVPEVWKELQPVQDRLDARFPGLRTRLDGALDRAHADCPDTAAAIAHAQELAAIIKSWQKPQPQPQESTEQQVSEESPSGGQSEGDRPGMGSGDLGDEEKAREHQGKHRHKETPSPTCPEKAEPGDTESALQTGMPESRGTDSYPQTEENGGTESYTQSQEPMEPGIADLFARDAADLPRTRGERAAQTLTARHDPCAPAVLSVAVEGPAAPYTASSTEKEDALRVSIALRHRLQGLLQTHTRQDVAPGRRGGLDTAKLHRLRIGNPRVFRREEERAGLDTAVHILLDVSHSMSGMPIVLARQTCFAVAKALHGIRGVNPAVTAFPAAWPGDSVCPIMRHGAAVPRYLDMDTHGGTPLGPALWRVMQVMLPLREERKLILVVTDGEPDSPEASAVALDTARKAGFEVYGIGVRNGCIARLLPNSSRVVWNLSELPQAMFGLLQGALLRGGQHDGSR